MKKLYFFGLAVMIMLTSSCGKQESQITISGAFALYPLAVKWGEEYKKLHPELNIDIQAGGAGKGMADALSEQVSLGMVSREINEAEIKQGAWFVGVTKDAVIPTINANNPYLNEVLKKGMTKKQFQALWTEGRTVTWGEICGIAATDEVKVFKRSDAAGAAESWAKYLGKKQQDDLKGTGVYGDPGLAEAVKKDKFGVGFNNVIFAYDISTKKPNEGIRVIPIDLNENGTIDPEENFYDNMDALNAAILEGRYPSPPAKELYFVSKGKPKDPVVAEFLKWVLTDGQKYVKEAGFINLPDQKLQAALEKLK